MYLFNLFSIYSHRKGVAFVVVWHFDRRSLKMDALIKKMDASIKKINASFLFIIALFSRNHAVFFQEINVYTNYVISNEPLYLLNDDYCIFWNPSTFTCQSSGNPGALSEVPSHPPAIMAIAVSKPPFDGKYGNGPPVARP